MAESKQARYRYRQRMRAAGLRPVQIWVPDRDAPGFEGEVRRQVRNINAAAEVERDTLDFIAAATDWGDEPEGSA